MMPRRCRFDDVPRTIDVRPAAQLGIALTPDDARDGRQVDDSVAAGDESADRVPIEHIALDAFPRRTSQVEPADRMATLSEQPAERDADEPLRSGHPNLHRCPPKGRMGGALSRSSRRDQPPLLDYRASYGSIVNYA